MEKVLFSIRGVGEIWSFRTSAASVNLVCCRGTEGGSSSVERERRVEERRRERRGDLRGIVVRKSFAEV